MDNISFYRFPSVPMTGLAPLQSSELGELLALAGAEVGAYPQEAKAAKDAAERQGEKPHANGSPRSYLEAAPLSSRATTGSRVHSAASYSAADCWATSKGDDMEQEGDEEHGSEMLESSGDDEAGVTLRRSGRNHRTDSKRAVAGEKRKVGRPIIYCGDPDAPDLTPQERRRIRRRIANRESARRVRARRQDLLEDMAIKAKEMEDYNASLMRRAESVEEKHKAMMAEVAAINDNLRQKCRENEALQAELQAMKSALLAAAGKRGGGSGGAAAGSVKEEAGAAAGDVAPFQQPSLAQPSLAPLPMPNAVISSGFSGSPFVHSASLGAPDMQLASATRGGAVVPAVTTGQQPHHLLVSAAVPPPAAQAGQGASTSAALRAPSIEPAALTLSLDRSLSEFLNEVVCF